MFLDIWLQGSRLDGLQLLDAVKEEHPELPVVMISGHGNIETAVVGDQARRLRLHREAVQGRPAGAGRRARAGELAAQARGARSSSSSRRCRRTLVGRSPADQPAAPDDREGRADQQPHPDRRARRAPARNSPRAPSTRRSARADGPFVVINAAAITPERMEIELFGVEAAQRRAERKVGALEEAHGGTLFIDEIADMPRETQNKILRVLVDQTFQRVGGSTKVTVDVRIVSSTSRNIEAEIAAGKFREDLYHRLSVVPIRVPPLAERREDIPELVEYFMDADFAGDRPAQAHDRRRRAWPCCSRTTGRATCGSCATTSSG